MAEVFRQAMASTRRAIGVWAALLGAMAFLAMTLSPVIRASEAYAALWQELPDGVRGFFVGVDDATGLPGYIDGQFLAFVPVLLGIHVVLQGTRALAVARQDGTMDFWLVQPITRRRYLLEHAAAIATGVVAITAIIALALWLGAWAAGVDAQVAALMPAVARTLPVTLLFAAIGLFAGAAASGPRMALVAAFGALAALYALGLLGASVGLLADLAPYSPFHHDARGALPLVVSAAYLGVALVLVALAVVVFQRRDLALH